MHMRFVVGTDVARLRQHVQQHLAAHGFGAIEVSEPVVMAATRLDPDNAWVRFALASIAHSTGQPPVLLPNLGGSLPNDVFADILGLPTVWVPHSYPACQQHAPDEHLLAAGGARGAGADDGPVLGPRRPGSHAAAPAPRGRLTCCAR